MKTAGLRIRVEPGLRDSFLRACKANDLSASQVIRAFMREYIENNKVSLQRSLFDFLDKTQGASTQFVRNESSRQTGE
jgi:antitoxin component of RelBE/YafQ-DinJ toxin-antitoxin module